MKAKMYIHFLQSVYMRQKADTHTHTQYSGFSKLGIMKFPESVTSPEQQVENARKNGYSVLCITDHDEIAGAFIAQKYAKNIDDIDIVAGEEVMTSDGEVIGLWLTEKIQPGLTVEETIDIIRAQGGVTIAPHPFSFHVAGLNEKIFGLDLDAIEVINGGHVDEYSNHFSQLICEEFPGTWAEISASDSHSKFTMGYNWTEFEGEGEKGLRDSILNKKTVACGMPAPVFTQTQWSAEVVLGGQKLMKKALKGQLEPVENDHLIEKINSIPDLKKVAGIGGGNAYLFTGAIMLATVLSTAYLNSNAKKHTKEIPERIERCKEIMKNLQ